MKRKKTRNYVRNCFFVVIIGVMLLAFIGKCFYQSNKELICVIYRIYNTKIQEPIRILQLADLHNSIFGEKNQDLVDLASKQSPDLILITGDLLNSNELNTDIATDLISDLSKIAPVYVSLGNHEVEYQQNYGTDIVQLYADAGAVVLDRQYQDLEVNGQKSAWAVSMVTVSRKNIWKQTKPTRKSALSCRTFKTRIYTRF